MLKHRILIAAALFLTAIAVLPSVAHACPGCWSATEGNTLGGGWLWSFLVLLSLPVTLVGSIGSWIYLQVRRANRKTRDLRPRHVYQAQLEGRT